MPWRARTTLALACALVIAMVLWMRSGADQRSELAPLEDGAESRRDVAHESSTAAREEARQLGTENTESQAPPQPVASAAAAKQLARLFGRCLAAESGAPLAACEILFNGFPPSTERAQRMGNTETLVLWAKSDVDGRFEIAYDAARELRPSLVIRSPGRRAAGGSSSALAPGEARDCGDVRLAPAHAVRGRVVDEAGHGVADVRLYVHSAAEILPGWEGVGGGEHAASDPEGHFAFAGGIAEGEWELQVDPGNRLDHLEPKRLRVPMASSELEVRVALRPSIRGRAVGEQGTPIEHARLEADPCADGARAGAVTDAQGRFALYDPCRRCTVTRLHALAGACEPATHAVPVPWGTADLELSLRRGLAFSIEVVEAATGQPVERFAVKLLRPEDILNLVRWRSGGEHNGGVLRIERVARGEHRLIVAAESLRYCESQELPVWIQDGEELRLRVELQPARCWRVRVMEEGGAPIAGALAELLVPPSAVPLTAFQETAPNAPPHGWALPFQPYRLDSSKTLADGIAELCVEPGTNGLALRVSSPHHAPRLHLGPPQESAEPIPFVLYAGATLRGTVQPVAFAQLEASVQLTAGTKREERIALHRESEALRIAEDGTFRLEHAPAGHWYVWIRTRDGELPEPVAEVDVPDSGMAEVELDLQRFAPGFVRGRVTLGGEPVPRRVLTLYAALPQQVSGGGSLALDERGAFAESALLPGRYRFLLLAEPHALARGAMHLEVPDVLDLLPGERRDLHIALPHRRLRLRFVDAQGAPLPAGTLVRGSPLDGFAGFSAQLDAKGWIDLDPAPTTPFFLQVGERRLPAEGALELPEVYDTLERTLVL